MIMNIWRILCVVVLTVIALVFGIVSTLWVNDALDSYLEELADAIEEIAGW